MRLVWVCVERLGEIPTRRISAHKRTEFGFTDVFRIITNELGKLGLGIGYLKTTQPRKYFSAAIFFAVYRMIMRGTIVMILGFVFVVFP